MDPQTLKGNEIWQLLKGKEEDILQTVKRSYQLHANGETDLPPSSFLQFPGKSKSRCIGLQAYIGGELNIAGFKTIASFPSNLSKGLERASAQIGLISLETGRLEAIFDGSIITQKRTAASAALGAQYLLDSNFPISIGIIGCGPINYETLNFILYLYPSIQSVFIFDVDQERANLFKQAIYKLNSHLKIVICDTLENLLNNSKLVSFGTTEITPHVFEFSVFQPGTVVLHLSLRDLSPEIILSAVNIVDDIDHIRHANTSVHLAEQKVGHYNFIQCSIGQILNKSIFPQWREEDIRIFSPFGLGILDITLAKLVQNIALEKGLGDTIDSFFPTPWWQRDE